VRCRSGLTNMEPMPCT